MTEGYRAARIRAVDVEIGKNLADWQRQGALVGDGFAVSDTGAPSLPLLQGEAEDCGSLVC